MSLSTIERNRSLLSFDAGSTDDDPLAMIETPLAPPAEPAPTHVDSIEAGAEPAETTPALAIFCYEDPESPVGQYVTMTVAALARRGTRVHLFTRRPYRFESASVRVHPVGDCGEEDLLGAVQEFTRRATNAFLRVFPVGTQGVTLLGHDWQAVSALLTLRSIGSFEPILELHSIEWQRSEMYSDLSSRIGEIEMAGLREARTILVHQGVTAAIARQVVPECDGRIVEVERPFPVASFQSELDPGEVKARFHVGPVDPTILYIGDFSDSYGPDLLVKAMPAILKNQNQARLVLVGEGTNYWPMRVYSRYLLLDHAIRFAGDVQDHSLCELIQAADIVAVPSRAATPWWPILAAWAAGKPLLATHEAAPSLLEHEQDSVLVYPNEGSCVWGIERLLFDLDFARRIAEQGHKKLLDRFGQDTAAAQIERLIGINSSR
jgi:glycosyltransferase involved in cell wall biosynthesis